MAPSLPSTVITDQALRIQSTLSLIGPKFAVLALILCFAGSATAVTTVAGKTAGTFNVSKAGTAEYEIPIEAPPGTAGMVPTVSLNYGSDSGNGLLGVGWGLGGLSTITRCAATTYQDGVFGSVNFDGNDKFCLDGQRLMAISGTYGGNATEYRTEIDSYVKVISYTATGVTGGPAWFKVWTKSGRVMEYGNTADSRIEATGTSTARLWAVNKISDSSGNYQTYTYIEEGTTGSYRPNRIDYTGNAAAAVAPYNSVRFVYGTRTDSVPAYQAGKLIQTTQRLSSVDTYAGTALVKSYKLAYQASPTSGRSRLVSVTECGSATAGLADVCLNPTTFEFLDGSLGFTGPNYRDSNFSTPTTGSWQKELLDLNGDTRPDYVTSQSMTTGTEIHVSLSTGAALVADKIWLKTMTGDGNGWAHTFIDVDGDGLRDFVRYYMTTGTSGGSRVEVSLNTGSGFAPAAQVWENSTSGYSNLWKQTFVDLNADGLPDYVRYYQSPTATASEVRVNLNTRSGFSVTTQTWNTTPRTSRWSQAFVDLNGDGLPDNVRVCRSCGTYYDSLSIAVGLNTGSGFAPEQVWDGPLAGYGNYGQTFLDMNGDGLPDNVLYYIDSEFGSTGLTVKLNTGTGFAAAKNWGSDGAYGYGSEPQLTLSDVNGDGLPDYVLSYSDISDASISYKAVRKNTGNGLGGLTYLSIAPPGYITSLVDMDGDKLADSVGFASSATGDRVEFYRNTFASTVPDSVTKITDGFGASTQVEYRTPTDPNAYTYSWNSRGSFPVINVYPSLYLVKKVQSSTGIGTGRRSYYYLYNNARAELGGRGFLGFGWVEVYDEAAGTRSGTTYRQDFPYIGLVSDTSLYDYGFGITLDRTTVTHANTAPYPGALGIKQVYPSQTWHGKYDLNVLEDTLVTTETTSNVYDGYGNVTKSVVTTEGGGEIFTDTIDRTYRNDAANWFIGLPLQLTVTRTQSNPPTPAEATQNRITSFDYSLTTGLLTKEIIEPTDINLRRVTDYGYDTFGNRTSGTISGNGIATRTNKTAYDAKGQFPLTGTNALLHTESYAYDGRFGKLSSVTDPNRLTRSWTYDPFGREIQESRPDGTKTATTRTIGSSNPLVLTSQPDGAPKTTIYLDILGREIKSETQGFSGNTVVVSTGYDAAGRTVNRSRPAYGAAGSLYQYTYDKLGRITQEVSPSATTQYQYSGLRIVSINPKSLVTTKQFNARGEVVSVQASDKVSTQPTLYRYDPFGNLRLIQDAAGNVIDNRYDRRGYLIYQYDPDRGTTTYIHDVLGQLRQKTDNKLQTAYYDYDLLGRQTRRTEPEGITTWQYDTAVNGLGHLATATGSAGDVRTLSYDTKGRVSGVAQSYGGQSLGLQYGYDTLGRPATVTYPTGFIAEQRYNANGYLSELWGSDSLGSTRYWQATSLNADGQIYETTLGNGLTTRTSYDAVGRSIGILTGAYQFTGTYPPSLVGTVQNLGFIYDPIGNTVQRKDNRAALTENFTYDPLSRLTSSQVTGQTAKSYSYDELGNITFKTGVGNYTYSQVNAGPHAVTATSVGSKTFSYDANGNLTAGDGRVVGYTSYNLPNRIDVGGGSLPTTFVYGADRNRISSTGPEGTRSYLDDGQMRYERLTLAGLTTHTHYLYAMGKLVASYVTNTAGAATPNYLHHDHLGSIDVVTDGTGKVVERLSYDPHGKRRNATNWTDAVTPIQPLSGHRGFTEHEQLDLVGLIHMNGRVYNPNLGRFLSADPIVPVADDPQSYNRYSYVRNNPLSSTDPSGFDDSDDDGYQDTPSSQELEWQREQQQQQIQTLPEVISYGRRPDSASSVHFDFGYGSDNSSGASYVTGGSAGGSGGGATGNVGIGSGAKGGGSGSRSPDKSASEVRNSLTRVSKEFQVTARELQKAIERNPALKAALYMALGVVEKTEKGDAKGISLEVILMMLPVEKVAGQLHHIATDKSIKSGYTEIFESIFEKAGMSLNDAANVVYLEGHAGRHSPAYHDYVLDRLKTATEGLSGSNYEQALKSELEALKKEIIDSPELVKGVGLP